MEDRSYKDQISSASLISVVLLEDRTPRALRFVEVPLMVVKASIVVVVMRQSKVRQNTALMKLYPSMYVTRARARN